MFHKLCAVEDLQVRRKFFKIVDIYTSFQPKLSKCCHKVMVDNVGDRVIFLEKVVISKKKDISFLVVTCNATRDQYKQIHEAVVSRNLFGFFSVPTDQKAWQTLV